MNRVEKKIERLEAHKGSKKDLMQAVARTRDRLSSIIDTHTPRKGDLKIGYQTLKYIFWRNKGTPIKSALPEIPYIEMSIQPLSLISFGTVASQSTLRYMR